MGRHLKRHFTLQEVTEVLERYLTREIGISEAMRLLKIKRRQFFNLLKAYREQGQAFCLGSPRSKPTHQILPKAHQKILEELAEEKRLIDDISNPIRFYNYSYVKSRLKEKHGITVSLPSIITRAKKMVITKHVYPRLLMTVKYSLTT